MKIHILVHVGNTMTSYVGTMNNDLNKLKSVAILVFLNAKFLVRNT